MEVILAAIEKSGYVAGEQVFLALDTASSEFYRDGRYHLDSEGKSFDSSGFAAYLERWVADYPIISIEDGMAENDWDGWDRITSYNVCYTKLLREPTLTPWLKAADE